MKTSRLNFNLPKVQLVLLVCILCFLSSSAQTITPFSGGTSLTADKAANALSPAYTTLGTLTIAETNNKQLTNGSLILSAPSGWTFNNTGVSVTGVTGSVAYTNSTTITITFSGLSNGGTQTANVVGVSVRATEGAAISSSGNIRLGAGSTCVGQNGTMVPGTTVFGALSQTVGNMTKLVVTLPGQTFTDGATVAASGATGTVTAQTVGTSFNITSLTATDQFFNIITTFSGVKTIAYSGPGSSTGGSATYTTSVSFTSGVSTTTLSTSLRKAETISITATNGGSFGTASSSLLVNPRALTITSPSVTPKTYNGTTSATITGTLSGVLTGDIVTLVGTGTFIDKNAGTGKSVTAFCTTSGADSANYTITQPTGLTGNITAASLTVTATSGTKVYGIAQSTPVTSSLAFGSSGLQAGETIGSVTVVYGVGALVGSAVVGSISTITPSAATGGTFAASNYSITYTPNSGTLTVTAASLTITANNRTKVYGTTQSSSVSGASTFGSTGLQNGETIGSVTLTYGAGALTASAAVGSTSTITPSAATGGTFTASNYSITYTPNSGTLTVTAAPLNITANNASKCFGTTYTIGTTAFTSSGLQNGETIGGVTLTSSGASSGAASGSYSIVPSGASGGTFTASNYSISYVSGTLTVTPNNTITLTSAAGTNAQTVCINTAITNITYATAGATGATFSGLPSGVTGSWSAGVATISGSPSTTGSPFTYIVTMTGGCTGGTNTATGTITVNPSFTAGAIATSGETICYGGSPTLGINSLSAASGGSALITYLWKANGIDIPFTNTETYDPPPGLTVTTAYTRFAKDTACNTTFTPSSGTWTVTVTPGTVAGAVTGGTTICSGSNSGVLTLSGQVGSVVRWESAVSPFSSWTTITNTATSYTSGALTQTTQFRAVVQNGSCTVLNSTPTTVTVGVTTTWNGSAWSNGAPTSTSTAVINGNYTSATNGGGFSACTLTVSSGTILISSGDNITLNGALTVSSGSFTLANNANLIQTTSAANSGNINVNRNTATLMRQDYCMWSAPVAAQQLQAFSPETLPNRFYTYDSSTNLYAATSAAANFSVGTGYLIRMPNNHPATPTIWTGTFTGVPNNGNLTLGSLTANKYYSIGNPYPSTINADAFITNNSLTEALYFWRKTNNAATSSYATYTLAGGVSNSGGDALGLIPNGFIQVGQGFIAKVPSSANSLSFTNSMRAGNNSNQFLRSPLFERSRYWLNLTDDAGFFGQMMVAYMTGATNGYDPAIDGLFFGDSQTALTSIVDSQEYIIQGRALPFETTDVVTLGFKSELGGNYTISLNNFDGLFETNNQDIYLKDNLTATLTNLKIGPYSFTSEAGVFATRFEIVYESALGVALPGTVSNNIIVYKQNAAVVVNSGAIMMSKVELYDIRGRLLLEKDNLNAKEVRLNAGSINQVLIVRITTSGGDIVTRKIVN